MIRKQYYIVTKDLDSFKQGQIVELLNVWNKKALVTDRKKIGIWPCCRCPKINKDLVKWSDLMLLDIF